MATIQAKHVSSSRLQPLVAFLKSPVFIVFVICLGLMSYNLITTYRLRAFNSDDVFWQAILQRWHPFNGTTVTLGNSSIYVDKIPYFEFFQHVFGSSRKVLLMEAGFAAIAGFSGFYWASIYFLKKSRARLSYLTLLPFLWLTSFGYSFSSLYLNSNWRGYQLGVSFAIFALVAALWYGDIRLKSIWAKLVLALVAIYAGLQIYSDPYFVYFTVGPLVLFTIVLLVTNTIHKKQAIPVALGLLISLVSAKFFAALAISAGIRTATTYPMEFVQFDAIGTAFTGSLHSIIIIFSADFFGQKLNDIVAVVALLNFVLLCFVLYKACLLLKIRGLEWQKLPLQKAWPLFFAFVALLVFLSQTLSTLGQGTATYRYFLLLELIFVLLLALTLGGMRSGMAKYSLVALLIGAIVFNLGLTTFGTQDAKRFEVLDDRGNSLNYLIIGMLESRGYDKGYANYWDANISSYLSDGKISFLPTVCDGVQAQKWHWLIDDTSFDKKATKTFYLVNPDAPASCRVSDLKKQFGPAQTTLYIGDKTILLYNYDITPKMGIAK